LSRTVAVHLLDACDVPPQWGENGQNVEVRHAAAGLPQCSTCSASRTRGCSRQHSRSSTAALGVGVESVDAFPRRVVIAMIGER
jgi:hypothetical protein